MAFEEFSQTGLLKASQQKGPDSKDWNSKKKKTCFFREALSSEKRGLLAKTGLLMARRGPA